MTMADPLPPLREVIAAHGLSARKSLGQNFLLDLNLTRRIARAAGDLAAQPILEIGPGPGGLTRALLMEGAQSVVAVERDDRCLAALNDVAAAYPGRLKLVPGDALAMNWADLVPGPHKVVANLPYNVGTQLLIGWLTQAWPPAWVSLTLMFQKEVAERITATAGSKAYGRLSVLAQWRSRPRIALSLPPRAFTPPPKVASTVVHIAPTAPPADAPAMAALEIVVKAAFAQRRKMLRASLKALDPAPETWLHAAGIAPETRADALDVARYCRLARAYETRQARR